MSDLTLFDSAYTPTRKRSMSGTVLNQHIRQIRNIQICRQDLEPLVPNQRMKIPSSLINAFGAHLQKVLDDAPDGIDDPAIFSSWLGPMVTGTVKDGAYLSSNVR